MKRHPTGKVPGSKKSRARGWEVVGDTRVVVRREPKMEMAWGYFMLVGLFVVEVIDSCLVVKKRLLGM